jgi:uncharacterized protein (DUF924 family)
LIAEIPVPAFEDVLNFWFHETKPEQRFAHSDDFDRTIRTRFGSTLEAAARGELHSWRETLRGRLAEIIVLDQFSRNLYRGTTRAFAQDGMAMVLAQEAMRDAAHQGLGAEERQFLYLPFMHSESLVIHELAMKLFRDLGLESAYRYEILHHDIIKRFGRYPHRNEILGRVSTPEEIEFLKEPGSSF